MYLVTSEQMQLFDKQTIETRRIPGIVLMEHAGREVARIVLAHKPEKVVVLCGKGNNGGDGWIAARWLKHVGVPDVRVVTTALPEQLKGDAYTAFQTADAIGVPFSVADDETRLPDGDVYIDALLGTGARGGLRGILAKLAEQLALKRGRIVAVDVPSGVDASTGRVEGVVVRAHETVAFQFQKLGTAVAPGCYASGQVHVVDIGIQKPDETETAVWVTPEQFRGIWPNRPDNAHKGTFGRIGVVMGEMQGAALLAATGAARVGVGLVVLGRYSQVTSQIPWDYVVRTLPTENGLSNLSDCSALVLGPGLGQEIGRFQDVWMTYSGNGVLDADGLKLIPSEGEQNPSGRWVLTPHPKECARLLGWSTEQVQERRIEAVRLLARQTNSVVVLKGYHALISDPDGRLFVNPTGDASLSVAGTGDVLAGMIGGLLAQGLSPVQAATLAAWLHGRAGELAGEKLTKVSVMATDVVESISRAIQLHFDIHSGNRCDT